MHCAGKEYRNIFLRCPLHQRGPPNGSVSVVRCARTTTCTEPLNLAHVASSSSSNGGRLKVRPHRNLSKRLLQLWCVRLCCSEALEKAAGRTAWRRRAPWRLLQNHMSRICALDLAFLGAINRQPRRLLPPHINFDVNATFDAKIVC